MFLYKI